MRLRLELGLSGIMGGSIYGLGAPGWTLIYKGSGVLNLAMGELTLIGAYVSLTYYQWGFPFLVAVPAMLITGFILGLATERLFLRRMIGEPSLSVILVTARPSFF